MVVVDTNVLVYAADRAAPEHEPCLGLLRSLRSRATPWFLTWGIVYEFLRVTTHARVLRKPLAPAEAWRFVAVLLASPSLDLLVESERHASALAELVVEVPQLTGNLLHDAHIAALMREHAVRAIYSRDTDFHRFPGIEVRDPLLAAD